RVGGAGGCSQVPAARQTAPQTRRRADQQNGRSVHGLTHHPPRRPTGVFYWPPTPAPNRGFLLPTPNPTPHNTLSEPRRASPTHSSTPKRPTTPETAKVHYQAS